MARQLKKQHDSRHVHTIKTGDKQIVDSQAIAGEFYRFYVSIYNIDSVPVEAEEVGRLDRIRELLEASGLQAIPSAALEEMEKAISIEELGGAIAALPLGKRPGPDG